MRRKISEYQYQKHETLDRTSTTLTAASGSAKSRSAHARVSAGAFHEAGATILAWVASARIVCNTEHMKWPNVQVILYGFCKLNCQIQYIAKRVHSHFCHNLLVTYRLHNQTNS